MAVDYCKLPLHRFGFVHAGHADGGGDREELLKAVGNSE